MLTVAVKGGIWLFGEILTIVPTGSPLKLSATGSLKLPIKSISTVNVASSPAQIFCVLLVILTVKSLVIGVIVNVLFDTSKNVPLAHCTIINASLVPTLGTDTSWLPSFGTLEAKVSGKVSPPS